MWLTTFRPGRSRLFGPSEVIAFAQDLNRQLQPYEIQTKFTDLQDGHVHGQVIVLRDNLEEELFGPSFEVAANVREGLVVQVETMPPGGTAG